MSVTIPVKCTGSTARCCSKIGAAGHGKGAGLQQGLEGVDGDLAIGL